MDVPPRNMAIATVAAPIPAIMIRAMIGARVLDRGNLCCPPRILDDPPSQISAQIATGSSKNPHSRRSERAQHHTNAIGLYVDNGPNNPREDLAGIMEGIVKVDFTASGSRPPRCDQRMTSARWLTGKIEPEESGCEGRMINRERWYWLSRRPARRWQIARGGGPGRSLSLAAGLRDVGAADSSVRQKEHGRRDDNQEREGNCGDPGHADHRRSRPGRPVPLGRRISTRRPRERVRARPVPDGPGGHVRPRRPWRCRTRAAQRTTEPTEGRRREPHRLRSRHRRRVRGRPGRGTR